MPRKRKTRVTKARTTPRAPEGDEGDNLEYEIKAQKLRTLLEDFDTQTKSFFEKMRDDLKDYEKSIQYSYMVEVAKIPQKIREMDFEEYMNAGGVLTSSTLYTSDRITQDLEESIHEAVPAAAKSLSKTKSKIKKKGKKASEGQEDTGTAVKRPAQRGRNRGVLATSASTNMPPPPPSTARTLRTTRQRGMFETPSQRGGPSAVGWETPLITPKFDPRLPLTPTMVRRPRDGEMMVSLAGSPLGISNSGGKNMTMKKAAESILAEVDLDNFQVPDFQSTTVEYLKHLKKKLDAMPMLNT